MPHDQCTHEVAAVAGERQPQPGAPCRGRPEGGAESRQPGHEHDAPVLALGTVELRGVGDQADALEPIDRRAGAVDLPVEAVGGRPLQAPGHAGGESRARARRQPAGVGEDEGAGAVGALRLPGAEARLREQRRLLVDGEAAQRQRAPERRRSRPTGCAQSTIRGWQLWLAGRRRRTPPATRCRVRGRAAACGRPSRRRSRTAPVRRWMSHASTVVSDALVRPSLRLEPRSSSAPRSTGRAAARSAP